MKIEDLIWVQNQIQVGDFQKGLIVIIAVPGVPGIVMNEIPETPGDILMLGVLDIVITMPETPGGMTTYVRSEMRDVRSTLHLILGNHLAKILMQGWTRTHNLNPIIKEGVHDRE